MLRLQGRTPVLLVDVPGDVDDCVLMYGHLDKQPEFTGWSDGLDPWTPVIRDGKLYGRGGADDGYALFSSIAAIRALREQKIPHARCVVLIEASEESGSPDLPAHIDALGARLGTPSLVVCLDAECGNYEQLWCTTSLRGNLIGTLRADVLTEGVHSGMASGIVPSSMRVLRELLARVEDMHSGAILVDELNTPIPADRRAQAEAAATILGPIVAGRIPVRAGHAADVERPAGTAAQQHVAAHAERDGRRGHPALPQRRQRPAALHEPQAVVPAHADDGPARLPQWRSSARLSRIRRTAPGSASTWNPRWPAGMLRRLRRGSSNRCNVRHARSSARTRCTWAPAAASRSWACSARNSRARSS